MASTAGTRIISIEPHSQFAQGTMKTSRIPRRISLRRCSDGFVMASFESDGGLNGRGRNEDARALEVKRTFSESLPEISSNTPTRRRPLTASDLSSSVNRSRLRVAYQGLPGAFSESAAAKAYPNCEAVPCELFETAFD
ncbi:arogenate dehydratase/prephenate dehydratase 2, chloroplastic-like, partial [Phalaenopsis equestris]|uniref:arogenate dehydratase/prephenate dehydratase 2, chloroplastic-like n=1 Tax=Phalaenopsis equestris TaxID=78828 RepID=UPI0009E4BCB5